MGRFMASRHVHGMSIACHVNHMHKRWQPLRRWCKSAKLRPACLSYCIHDSLFTEREGKGKGRGRRGTGTGKRENSMPSIGHRFGESSWPGGQAALLLRTYMDAATRRVESLRRQLIYLRRALVFWWSLTGSSAWSLLSSWSSVLSWPHASPPELWRIHPGVGVLLFPNLHKIEAAYSCTSEQQSGGQRTWGPRTVVRSVNQQVP